MTTSKPLTPQLPLVMVDAMALGKVAVLFGGTSAERDISIMSGQGVLAALQSVGVDAYLFDPSEHPLEQLQVAKFTRCFIALHGRGGEDGRLQAQLEQLGLPYTGSGVKASSQAMDKNITKLLWKDLGIPTPNWQLVNNATACVQAFDQLGTAMIVKPSREGSSIGLTKVTQREQCEAAYWAAAKHDPDVLCEAFVAGEETTCPVIELNGKPMALPVIRIAAPEGNYDYQNKYFKNDTVYQCPSELPVEEETAIQSIAVSAFKALGCRGWARVDVMIDQSTRQPYALEINTAPGMTSHSLVPMSAKAAGWSYAQLCMYLLSIAGLDSNTKDTNAPVI